MTISLVEFWISPISLSHSLSLEMRLLNEDGEKGFVVLQVVGFLWGRGGRRGDGAATSTFLALYIGIIYDSFARPLCLTTPSGMSSRIAGLEAHTIQTCIVQGKVTRPRARLLNH
ncbi:hypothetical protein CEXT_739101 [Caerostris extrusa]|uniref:Uncharacterized protein n=1 Tax=Caerostris extrusa TaxID=172846 RepID=A0AAV4R8E3_CAEEX|nr:hypothetical protein CEXT_739101 [Caerostris extrusa]